MSGHSHQEGHRSRFASLLSFFFFFFLFFFSSKEEDVSQPINYIYKE